MNQTAVLLNYFPHLTLDQQAKFAMLGETYADWNAKINVISRKDMESFYERHVLHSLAIAKVITFQAKTDILDVGTGGGFPGIPLAILFPEVNFYLVDSIGKKITVVQEVCKKLGIQNVIAEKTRAESITKKFDFVVSRAVTDMSEFYLWVKKSFKIINQHPLPNGILYLKGGDLQMELKPFQSKVKLFNINEFFQGEFFETKKVVYLKGY